MTEPPYDPEGQKPYRTYRSFRSDRREQRRRRRRGLLAALVVAGVALVAAVVAGAVWGGGVKVGPFGSPAPTPTVTVTVDASQSPAPAPTTTPVVTLGWAGDTTPGSKYGMPPDNGRALFAQMRDELRAPDLMIVNLEGTYSTPGPSKSDGNTSGTSFSFQAPPSYAKALPWAGIDLVSVANNHSNDYFTRGLRQTTAALKAAGVQDSGLPGQITLLDVKGVRVAVIGFSPYPWNNDINDLAAARRLVRRAAAQADLVVVLMHAGAEGADKIHTPTGTEVAFGENRGDPRAFAHAVVDAGADLVFGSGPHVIRGIERYKGRLIAYSLGNFAGWGNFGLGGNLSLSGLLTVRIGADGRVHGGRWQSVYVGGPGVPHVDPANTAAHLVRQLSAADFAHTYALDQRGRFTAP